MGFFSGLLEKGLDTVKNVAKEMTDARPILEGEFPEKFYFDGDKAIMEKVISQLNELKELSLYFAFTTVNSSDVGGLLDNWNMYIFGTKKILINSSKKAYEYIVDGCVYGIREYHQKEKLDANEKRQILYTDKLNFYIGKAPSEEELKKPDERVFEKTCNYIHSYSYEEEKVDLVNKLFQEKIIDFTSAEFRRMYDGLSTYKQWACGSSAFLKMKNSGDESGILKKLEEKIQNSQIDDILDKAKNGIDNQSVVLVDNKYSVNLADGSCLEIDLYDCPKDFQYVQDESICLKYTNASGNYIAMLYVKGGAFYVQFYAGSGEIKNTVSFYKESSVGKIPEFPKSLADVLYFVMDSNTFAKRFFDIKFKLMNLYEAMSSTKIRNAYISSEKDADEARLLRLAEKKKIVAEERSKIAERKAKENEACQTKKALDDF
ncbi:hypothetical protein [Fibrobacter sp.]|uniref:hypothetical protein n=1 Tax=Fibrobacter sp. TaxID=35828 RepID=UPI0025B9C648|nr:hypothetical protein [Fibrobacter sp.]MBR3072485.1 hypothetical protein [Fibrobacter sp.]